MKLTATYETKKGLMRKDVTAEKAVHLLKMHPGLVRIDGGGKCVGERFLEGTELKFWTDDKVL